MKLILIDLDYTIGLLISKTEYACHNIIVNNSTLTFKKSVYNYIIDNLVQ